MVDFQTLLEEIRGCAVCAQALPRVVAQIHVVEMIADIVVVHGGPIDGSVASIGEFGLGAATAPGTVDFQHLASFPSVRVGGRARAPFVDDGAGFEPFQGEAFVQFVRLVVGDSVGEDPA